MHKRHLLRAIAGLAALALAGAAPAQDFPPKKAVTLMVGFAPGAAADAAARLIGSIGPLTIAPHMMKLPYDPFKDLAPVSGGVHFPNVLVVNSNSGIKTLADFVAAAPTALPHLESGKLMPLATTGLTRPAYMPNVPTVAETGYPGFEALNWYAFVAPAKTPTPLLDRWNQEIVKVLNDAGVKDALNKLGLSTHPTTRTELTSFMQKESAKWGAIVRERKITNE